MSVSFNLPLDDILQTVERPVVFDVIRKLQDAVQISSKTQIRFYGEDAKAMQYNSSITKDEHSDNLWPHTPNLTIEVEEDHDPDRLLCTTVKGGENPPIFLDKELDIAIKPVYSSSIVKIHFIYKAADKNEATRWRNEIRTRFSMLRDVFIHDVAYSYHLPEVYIAILKEIYRLRENVGGYGDTFEYWLTSHMTNKATLLTNQSGEHAFWAIAESQNRIQGQFDFEGMPEKPTREDEPNLWATSFTYVFRYDKPINSYMVYPVIIHQQVLSTKYRYDTSIKSYIHQRNQFSDSLKQIGHFEQDVRDMYHLSNRGLSLPSFDEFIPSTLPTCTVRVATVLACVSPEDKRSLFSLKELPDVHIKQAILDFLQAGEHRFITLPYGSIIQLHLYEDQRVQDQTKLAIDSNLNIVATQDLDLRKTYRVRISLVANLNFLSYDALKRLKANPNVARLLLTAINHSINTLGRSRDIRHNRLPRAQLNGLGLTYARDGWTIVSLLDEQAYDTVGDENRHDLRGNTGLLWGLVETLFIKTKPAQPSNP